MTADQRAGELRVGCSGWQYDHWRGDFYPSDLPKSGWFAHYARCFDRHGVRLTISKRVVRAERAGNRLTVTLGSDYSDRLETREVDQLVVEHGTLPLDELYFDLKPLSINLGAVDYDAMIAGRPQEIMTNPEGAFRLYRIGDAVAGRNVHAAIYDALRLCKDV